MFGLKIPFLLWFTHKNEFIATKNYSLRFTKVCAQIAVNEWTGKVCHCQPSAARLTSISHFSIYPHYSTSSSCWEAFASPSQFTGGLIFFKVTAKLQAAYKCINTTEASTKIKLSECRSYLLGRKSNQVPTNHMLYWSYWLPFWGMYLAL